uniref:Uncharacterized protein n=1 Tax=Rhizophora mucronata TaxID=61149 RepID=A0A2P2QA55_RHIMU
MPLMYIFIVISYWLLAMVKHKVVTLLLSVIIGQQ